MCKTIMKINKLKQRPEIKKKKKNFRAPTKTYKNKIQN